MAHYTSHLKSPHFQGLRSELRSSEPKVKELRMVVGMRKKAWDDHQRKLREAAERQAEMERKQREEKERLSRMAEERAQREVRLAKIRQQQEEALRKVREEKALETTKPPSKYERRVVNQESPPKERKKSATPPGEVITPIPVAEPVGRVSKGSRSSAEVCVWKSQNLGILCIKNRRLFIKKLVTRAYSICICTRCLNAGTLFPHNMLL